MLRLTSLADYSRIPQLIFKKSLNVQKSPILIYRTLYQNPLRKGCKCGRTLPDKFRRSLIFNKRTLLVRFASQHASKAANIKNQSQEIKRLLALARPEKWKIGGAVVLLLISSSISISVPYFIGKLIDIMYTSNDNHVDIMSTLKTTCIGLSFVFLVGATANMGRLYLIQTSGQNIIKRLRQRTFSSILSQEMAFFDKTSSGELITRLSSDTALVGKALTDNVSDGMRACVQAIGGVSLMIYTSPKLTGVALIVVPPVMIFAIIYGRFLRKITKKTQDELSSSSQLAEERFSNMRTVRAFAREGSEIQAYNKTINNVYELARKEALARATFFGFTSLSGNLIALLVLYSGGAMMADAQITVGHLTSFLMYTVYVGISITGLGNFYTELMKGLGASTRIWQITDKQPLIPLHGGLNINDVIKDQSINLTDVAFTYPSRPNFPILENFNLDVPSGSVTAIVGESGSGKSTITSLLLRHYDTEGTIKIGGVDIKDLDPSTLREYVGTVSQEPILFSSSIYDNIAYGVPECEAFEHKDILEAAKQANAYNFIANFPDGFDTMVGERGQMLSGGQRQRIAIGRAILKNPKILLLDEATSALDAESEYLVQDALQRLMKTRTTIIIAHRLSTIKCADQIAVLHNGNISEIGSYEALMTLPDGKFKQLVEKQSFDA